MSEHKHERNPHAGDPEKHAKRNCHLHPDRKCSTFDCMAYVSQDYFEWDHVKEQWSRMGDGGRCSLLPW